MYFHHVSENKVPQTSANPLTYT